MTSAAVNLFAANPSNLTVGSRGVHPRAWIHQAACPVHAPRQLAGALEEQIRLLKGAGSDAQTTRMTWLLSTIRPSWHIFAIRVGSLGKLDSATLMTSRLDSDQ